MRKNISAKLYVIGLILAVVAVLIFSDGNRKIDFKRNKKALKILGNHLILGYDNLKELEEPILYGAIAGIYISQRNVRGKSIQDIYTEIKKVQNDSYKPLFIATDQEGGVVSRLSPPLKRVSSLARALINGSSKAIERYAEEQARQLKSLGVNLNLSPVVDLQPELRDVHNGSRIYSRAISRNPFLVSEVAQSYCSVLNRWEINCVLKHFPGLGSIKGDTHILAGVLESSVRVLEKSDWLPFKKVIKQTKAFIMLGHVFINNLDPENPASLSKKVVKYIRKNWKKDVILITDDLNMQPIKNIFFGAGGVGGSCVKAINAGIDLLLITRPGYFHECMSALLNAFEIGSLKPNKFL